MKHFLIKTSIFLLPITLAFTFTELFYSTNKGDLLRIGYIADIYDYNTKLIFENEYNRKIHYSVISEINLSKKQTFKVLIIGDSFSGQGEIGYQNYLGEINNKSVLYYDIPHLVSPMQTLYSITNGDMLDKIKVDFIVLQSVERGFVDKNNFDKSNVITIDSLRKSIHIYNKNKRIKKENNYKIDKLFSNRVLKFITFNFKYLFDDNAYNSETYIVPTTKKLFSVNNNNLLFYLGDIDILKTNSNIENINKLNNELNYVSEKLIKKSVKLIVLPSPDKYDIYYNYILEKEKYQKPLFFEHLDKMQKRYLYVDSKNILTNALTRNRDVYFYDDTHWSPWASKLMANEINKLMKENK